MDLKEEVIWKQIQQKNLNAFEVYYKEHFKCLLLMACKYLRDSSVAEEIVNDVFMKLWEDGHKITVDSSLKSYMYRAIINRCINLINKNKREVVERMDISLFPDTGYELKQIEENELKVKLYSAISQLPDQCRRVFEMSRFEELKQQEIADKLGISIKTVKNHITIALKQLNALISGLVILLVYLLKNLVTFN